MKICGLTANQWSAIAVAIWFSWSLALARAGNISWFPALPLLAALGLALAALGNAYAPPVGLIIVAAANALPLAAAVQNLVKRRRGKREAKKEA